MLQKISYSVIINFPKNQVTHVPVLWVNLRVLDSGQFLAPTKNVDSIDLKMYFGTLQ